MTDVVPRPRPGLAYWTAYQAPEGDTRPVDPLAFDMFAERLGNVLLPGITGRTDRVRYLSMVCAGLALTAPARNTSGRIAALRREAFLPFERAWAFAVCVAAGGELKEVIDGPQRRLKYEYRGLKGVDNVLAYWREQCAKGDSRVSPTSYRLLKGQSAQGGLGAYLITLRTYGFVDGATLQLLEPGRALAARFLDGSERMASNLISTPRPTWSKISRVGEQLDLRTLSREEVSLVSAQLFGSRTRALGRFRALMPKRTAGVSPEEILKLVAVSDDPELAVAARFALAFDRLRRAALESFGRIGEALGPHGEMRLAELDTATWSAVTETSRQAEGLLALQVPDGQDGIVSLARRLVDSQRDEEVVRSLLLWHAEHRAPWITLTGDRLRLGRHGNFAWSDRFHGFTVASLQSILDDMPKVA